MYITGMLFYFILLHHLTTKQTSTDVIFQLTRPLGASESHYKSICDGFMSLPGYALCALSVLCMKAGCVT